MIELIDCDRLEVYASGTFDASCHRVINERLTQLVSSGQIRLRIDFETVTKVDALIVAALQQAKSKLEASGGTLEIIGADKELAAAIAGSNDDLDAMQRSTVGARNASSV